MRKVKKIMALLLTLAMVMGLSLTAMAASSATITIEHAGTNARFNYVQIVTPNPETETGWDIVDNYTQYFTAQFTGMTEQKILAAMIKKAKNEEPNVENYDSKYAAVLDSICNTITAPTAESGSATPFTVSSAGVYVIRGFEPGYVYGTMSAYISFKDYNTSTGVPTALENATVEAKRVPTTVDKSSDDQDKVTEIGKTLTYTVKGIVPYIAPTELSTAKYWITDTITGADYKLVKEVLKVNVTTNGGFEMTYDVTPKTIDGKTGFSINLSEILKNNKYANDEITVSYQAVVTDIKVGNEVKVGKGENNGDYGHDSETSYTGEIELLKLASDETPGTNEDNAKLENAEFVMYKEVSGAKKYATVENGKLTGWVDSKDDATKLYTDLNGKIKVEGLDLGTYYFEETKAPEGYSLDSAPVDVELTITGATATETVTGEQAVKFNTTLAELPGTGGIGTTIFTIGGCVIMIAAAGLYFASRRKHGEN